MNLFHDRIAFDRTVRWFPCWGISVGIRLRPTYIQFDFDTGSHFNMLTFWWGKR
jgi:hypothetical protein